MDHIPNDELHKVLCEVGKQCSEHVANNPVPPVMHDEKIVDKNSSY